MAVIFANFASSTLAATITSTALVIAVRTGDGKKFPLPLAGDYFMLVLEDADGNCEIVKCTGRNNDLLTVVRAQEGTVRDDFPAGARVENRLTAGSLAGLMFANAPAPTGDIVMQDPTLAVRSTYYEGTNPDGAERLKNRIAIPQFGRPFVGPADSVPVERIMTTSDIPLGVILLWSGHSDNIPARWALCNGKTVNSLVTPDLRGLFVMGAAASGDSGPGFTTPNHKKLDRGASTGPLGVHSHGGRTGDTVLKTDDVPGHRHSYSKTTVVGGGGGPQPTAKLYAFRNATGNGVLGVVDPFFAFPSIGGEIGGGVETGSENAFTTYSGGTGTVDPKPADGHSHVINPDGAFPDGVSIPDISPAWYALCYIMKVA
jgi:hypothetical protein